MYFAVQSLSGPARRFPMSAPVRGPTPAMSPTEPAPKPYPNAGSEKSRDTDTESKTTVDKKRYNRSQPSVRREDVDVHHALVVPKTSAPHATSGLQQRVNGRHATFQNLSFVKRWPAIGFMSSKNPAGFSAEPTAFSASACSTCSSDARGFSSTSSGNFDEDASRESCDPSAPATAPPATSVSISGRMYAVSGTNRIVMTSSNPH